MSQWNRSKNLMRSGTALRQSVGLQILAHRYKRIPSAAAAYYSSDNNDFRKTLDALRKKTQSTSPPGETLDQCVIYTLLAYIV